MQYVYTYLLFGSAMYSVQYSIIMYHHVSHCTIIHHHSASLMFGPAILVFSGMINFFLGESLEEDAPLMESGLDSLSAVDFRNQALGP